MELVNRVIKCYVDQFVFFLIDDILIFSRSSDNYDKHFHILSKILKDKKHYAKISKCEFLLDEICFLRHVI